LQSWTCRIGVIFLLTAVQPDFDWTRRRIHPISIENELRSLFIISLLSCQEQLRRYPTTLEQDVAELSAGTLAAGSNKRNAVVLLRGEKEVCHFYVTLRDLASSVVVALGDAPGERRPSEGFVWGVAQECPCRSALWRLGDLTQTTSTSARYLEGICDSLAMSTSCWRNEPMPLVALRRRMEAFVPVSALMTLTLLWHLLGFSSQIQLVGLHWQGRQ